MGKVNIVLKQVWKAASDRSVGTMRHGVLGASSNTEPP